MLVCKSTGNKKVRKLHRKEIFERRKHKIIINGGSKCKDVDNTFEIQWIIKPEAGLMTSIKRVKEDITNLRMKDVVIVWGWGRHKGCKKELGYKWLEPVKRLC
jgi:hypothetical protein